VRVLRSIAAASLLVAAGAGVARAAEPPRAGAFDAVLKCRGLSEDAARLACYDAAAGRMGEAEKNGDIVVIDRAQASAAHREAFGLHVPSLDFVTKALRPEEVDSLQGVVKSARADQNGFWTFWLEDGAKWRQISGQLARDPKPGSKVRIRRGTVGSFLMNVDNQGSIKVHRDE
jgi:hypothetical protein